MKRLLWLALLLLGCDTTPLPAAGRLRGPLDSVVAGANDRYMYVAGGVYDALYILDLATVSTQKNVVQTATYVRAPNKFFPLEIPAGRSPIALSRTGDGRFVLSLASADHSLYLVDADAQLVVRRPDGEKERIDVGAGASSIVRAPNQVGPGERFYVSNVLEKSLRVIDVVRDANGAPSFVAGETIANTGAMKRMIIADDGVFIFGTDLSSHFVHRVDTRTNTTADIDVTGFATDVALGAAGAVLFVARPDVLGVDMYNPLSGAKIQPDESRAPLLADEDYFHSIYLGYLPARLRAVELPQGGLVALCKRTEDDGTETSQEQTINSLIAVATDSGQVFFIDAAQQKLVDTSFCSKEVHTLTVGSSFDNRVPDPTPLAPCTDDNSRFKCDPDTGILYAPPAPREGTLNTTLSLVWEGRIRDMDRTAGGGSLLEDGALLADQAIDLSAFDVRVGDRVIIHSAPALTSECQALYPDRSKPEIAVGSFVQIGEEGNQRRALRLEPALRGDCFPTEPGAIQYEVVVHAAYAVRRNDARGSFAVGRLALGETYGTDGEAVRFTIARDQMPPPEREDFIQIEIGATYAPLISGIVFDSYTQSYSSAGRIPTSISIGLGGPLDGERKLLALLTYAANDAIVFFQTTGSDLTTFVVR